VVGRGKTLGMWLYTGQKVGEKNVGEGVPRQCKQGKKTCVTELDYT